MSADLFIYVHGRLPVPRQEIEEAVEEVLSTLGEVTGAGLGERGANIDVEIFDEANVQPLIPRIREALLRLGLPLDTVIDSAGLRTNLKGERSLDQM